MRNILMTVLFLAAVSHAFASEGIEFSKGSWKEMLDKAKKEHKLIFIDVFTEWCGPCKKMVAEVFPQQQVADLFNASFINFKIDAEKGEGVQVAQQFNVRAYPTYLFVNGDGQLVYRTSGYLPAEAFMKQANIALAEQRDPKPIAQWNVEYEKGNREKTFLLGYLKKKNALQEPSAEVIEAFLQKASLNEVLEKSTLETILAYSTAAEYIPGGKLFDLVAEKHKKIDSILQRKYSCLNLLQQGMLTYFQKQVVNENRKEMIPVTEKAVATLSRLMDAPQKQTNILKVKFDFYTKNYVREQFDPAVKDYVLKGLFRSDPNEMIEKNKPNFDRYMEPYLTGKADSSTVPQWQTMKHISKLGNAVNWAYSVRNAAEAVYNNSTDPGMLKTAQDWAKRAFEVMPHFSTGAVYAGLMYKNGQKEAATAFMEQWKNSHPLKQALFEENINKMKAGKAPENLWK
ncbi:MAG: thioredoxin family protein [Chitinophagaceae bacterium]